MAMNARDCESPFLLVRLFVDDHDDDDDVLVLGRNANDSTSVVVLQQRNGTTRGTKNLMVAQTT